MDAKWGSAIAILIRVLLWSSPALPETLLRPCEKIWICPINKDAIISYHKKREMIWRAWKPIHANMERGLHPLVKVWVYPDHSCPPRGGPLQGWESERAGVGGFPEVKTMVLSSFNWKTTFIFWMHLPENYKIPNSCFLADIDPIYSRFQECPFHVVCNIFIPYSRFSRIYKADHNEYSVRVFAIFIHSISNILIFPKNSIFQKYLGNSCILKSSMVSP